MWKSLAGYQCRDQTRAHHVTFKTSRLNEMMAWYGTVLGGTINFKDDHNGWMTNDEANQ